jgi:mediator of RNA polymerase II transcription subunit 16
VATHSACQKINLYRVHIAWNPAQWDQNQPKQASPTHPFPTPSFHIFHSKIENSSSIFTPSGGPSDESKEFSPGQSSLYSLTHLDIVPGQSDSTGGSSSGPWILAVYSNPVHATGHDPQQQAFASSVIVRWQVENAPLTLHPKFDEVISKKNNVQAKVYQSLLHVAEALVVALDPLCSDKVVAENGTSTTRRHLF